MSSCPVSQQLPVHNLPNHPSPEVGHVFLERKAEVSLDFWLVCLFVLVQSCVLFVQSTLYLCECDWLVFGDVICILAGKHSTVTTVHLLWDFLKRREMFVGIVQKECFK